MRPAAVGNGWFAVPAARNACLLYTSCGVFLASSVTSFAICRDLSGLFRQSCPDGLVAFVTQSGDYEVIDADIFLSLQDEPQSLVQKIRSEQTRKAS